MKNITKGTEVNFKTTESHPVTGSGIVFKVFTNFFHVIVSHSNGEYKEGSRLIVWNNELV